MGPDIRPELLKSVGAENGEAVRLKLRADASPVNGSPQHFFTPEQIAPEVAQARSYIEKEFLLKRDVIVEGDVFTFDEFIEALTSEPITSRSLTTCYMGYVQDVYAASRFRAIALSASPEQALRMFVLDYDMGTGFKIGVSRLGAAEEHTESEGEFNQALTEGIGEYASVVDKLGLEVGMADQIDLFLLNNRFAKSDANILNNNDPTGEKFVNNFLYEITDPIGQVLADKLRADTGPYRAGKQLFADVYRLLQPEFARLIA